MGAFGLGDVDQPQVHDVGFGGAGIDQLPDFPEEMVGVVVGQVGVDVQV